MAGPAHAARRPLVDQLFLVAVVGVGLGALEYLLALLGPTAPPGTPGSGAPSPLAYLGMGATVLLLPAVLGAGLGHLAWPWRGRGWLPWAFALIPTAYVCLDQLAHARQWAWAGDAWAGVPLRPVILAVVLGLAIPAVALGVVCGHRVSRRRRSPAWLSWVVLLVLPVLSLAQLRHGALPPAGPAPVAGAPNVLLLTVDTLRADELASYGGRGLPAMDSLVASGVRATGWAPSPWTLPSFASLFSGVGPTASGAAIDRAVDGGLEWWPTRLREAGWETSAVVSNPYLNRRYGMGRGFARHEHAGELERLDPVGRSLWVEWLHRQWERFEPSDGHQVAGRAIDWLAGAPDGRPWLLWVHLVDPHLPYRAHDQEGAGWLEPLAPFLESGEFRHLEALREGEIELDRPARQALRELYHREALYADSQLGRVLKAARDASGARPLLWALTSDHGEEFFEHGGFEHGHALHGEVLRVPLAIGGLPGLAAGSFGGAMSLLDIGPTLFSLLGLPAFPARPLDAIGEESLLPWAKGRDRSAALLAAPPDRGQDAVAQLVQENLLYGPPRTRWQWPSGRAGVRVDPTGELRFLQLREDPTEAHARADSLRADEEQLLLQVDLWRERMAGRGAPVHRRPQDEQQLRALGYIR